MKSPDALFSSDPKGIESLVKVTNQIWKGMGQEKYVRSKEERKNIAFRRSLYFVKDLKKKVLLLKSAI